MKHVEINIGNVCNMKCLFCMSIYNKDLLLLVDEKEVLNKIIYYYKLGYNSIGFIGGEPTLHPSFLKLVKLAKKLNFLNISVITNGFKFANKEFFIRYIESGGNNIKLSLHCFDNFSGEQITGIKNIFDIKKQMLDNFFFLKKDNNFLSLQIQTVINFINYSYLSKIIDIALKYDTNIKLQYMGYYNDYPYKNLEKTFVSLDLVVNELYNLFFKYKEAFLKNIIVIDDIPICYLKKYFSEKIMLKIIGYKYDYINTIEDIRNQEKFDLKERKREKIKEYPLKECVDCKYLGICPGFYKGYFKFLQELEGRK